VSPRAVPDAVVKRRIPSLCRESNHRTPIVQPVLRKVVWEGVDWINLALNRIQCRAFVNTEMNLPFAQKAGNFLIL
jgi:hypothetical protein